VLCLRIGGYLKKEVLQKEGKEWKRLTAEACESEEEHVFKVVFVLWQFWKSDCVSEGPTTLSAKSSSSSNSSSSSSAHTSTSQSLTPSQSESECSVFLAAARMAVARNGNYQYAALPS